jgi:aminopeptidase N
MRRAAGLVALGGVWACSTPAPEPAAPPAAVSAPARASEITRASTEPPGAARACVPAEHLPVVEQPPLEAPPEPSDVNLRSWVETLAGPGLRGREAGTADALRAARSIAERFSALGIDRPDVSGYCRPFADADLRDHNVVAHLPPREDRCRWVVLGAHYDALGVDRRGRIHPGADDNASGVSLLLEAARLLAGERRPDAGVVFAAFGGEEKDLS